MTGHYSQTAVTATLFRIVSHPCSGKCGFSGFPSPVTDDTPQHTDNAEQECEYKSLVSIR